MRRLVIVLLAIAAVGASAAVLLSLFTPPALLASQGSDRSQRADSRIISYSTLAADRSVSHQLAKDDVATALNKTFATVPRGKECSDALVKGDPFSCLEAEFRRRFGRIAWHYSLVTQTSWPSDLEVTNLLALSKDPDGAEKAWLEGSRDVPAEAGGALRVSALLSRVSGTWSDDFYKKASAAAQINPGSPAWSVNGIPFAANDLVVRAYVSDLPVHRGTDAVLTVDRNLIVFERYLEGFCVFRADLRETPGARPELRVYSPYAPRPYGEASGNQHSYVTGGYGLAQRGPTEVFVISPALYADLKPLPVLGPFQLDGQDANNLVTFAGRFVKCLHTLDASLTRRLAK
jgi:hypothetical protein